MSSFAIIETGGKQYRVANGDSLSIEKIEGEVGSPVTFDRILLLAEGERVTIGTPYVSGAQVEATIVSQNRDKKKIVFRYHSKTRYHKHKSHRQHRTNVTVKKVA